MAHPAALSYLYRRLGRKPPKSGPVRQAPPRMGVREAEYRTRLARVIDTFADHVEAIGRAYLGGRADAKRFPFVVQTPAGPWESSTLERAEADLKRAKTKFPSVARDLKIEANVGAELAAVARKITKPPRSTGPLDTELKAAFDTIVQASGLERWLGQLGGKIVQANSDYTKRVVRLPPVGVATQTHIEGFRRKNVSLITNMRDEQTGQIADILRQAQATGQRWEEIVPAIRDRIDVTHSRAKLIARDQTNKFSGEMQRATQTAAGIEEYTWRTAGDMAVRGRPGGEYEDSKEDHWALQNKTFRWDSPPLIPGTSEHAHPGQRIQCRCQAIPKIPFFE